MGLRGRQKCGAEGIYGFTKTLCMAGKRFDSAACHAIDHRQPYRWARFAGDASGVAEQSAHSEVFCGERAAEWSW
jgi:hypothetical protein